MPSERYTDIHMEKRYTNGHSLKGYYVRLTQEQKDFLKSLPKGEGSDFVRQAINDKISSSLLAQSGTKEALWLNQLEARKRRKLAVELELDRIEKDINLATGAYNMDFSVIREMEKNGSLKLEVVAETRRKAFALFSTDQQKDMLKQLERQYGHPIPIMPSQAFPYLTVIVDFSGRDETGEVEDGTEVEEDFLTPYRKKNEPLEEAFHRYYQLWKQKDELLEVNVEKRRILRRELEELEAAEKTIPIYKAHSDIQIYNTEPAPEPLKRGSS